MEKIRDLNLNELLERDKKIVKLSKELRETERRLVEATGSTNPLFGNQMKTSRNASPFQGDLSQIHSRNMSSYSPLASH